MISNLLTIDTIIPSLKSKEKKEIIHEMVEWLFERKLIKDVDKIEKALLDREKLGSTGIGRQIAIPHAKCDEVEGLLAVFGKSNEGIDFDALDDKKVHYIFLLLSNKKEPGKSLKALARISRLFKQNDFCKNLKELETAEEILATIGNAEQSL